MDKKYTETEAKQKLLQNVMANNTEVTKARQGDILQNYKNSLQNKEKNK